MADEEGERSKSVVMDMYAAGTRGDVEGMLNLMADEAFVLNEPSFLPYGGTYRTQKGMLEAFTKIAEYLDVSSVEVDHMVAEGDRVFAVSYAVDRGSGERVLAAEEYLVRDGKIVEMRVFYNEARSLAGAAVV
jgi:ketosteroid isomerase-like protein